MRIGAPRRLMALAVLSCVVAACNRSPERTLTLSEIYATPALAGMHFHATGIVTYADPAWHVCFVQDHGVAIYLNIQPGSTISAGDRVEIAGKIPGPGMDIATSTVRVLERSTPLPTPIRVNQLSSLPQFYPQFVEVAGSVRWTGEKHGRPSIQLGNGKEEISVFFRDANPEDLPAVGSEVIVAGVAAADDQDADKKPKSKIFSASARQLHLVKAGAADPFSQPLRSLGELKGVAAGTQVHISGEISKSSADTASIHEGAAGFPLQFAEGAPAVSGKADLSGFWNGSTITHAIARSMNRQPSTQGAISQISDLKQLSIEAAGSKRAVHVRAIVTYADSGWGVLFVQDATAAAYVDAHGINIQLQPGDIVDISGVSGPGGYAPQIDQPTITFVRKGALPKPLELDFLQENLASADSRWCTWHGVVHAARQQYGRTTLQISAAANDLTVQFPVAFHSETLIDKDVSLTGVFGVLFNERRQAVGHQIFVPSPDFLKVSDPQTAQPDPVTIASLQRYDPKTDQRHSVTLNGTVVLKVDNSTIFVQDATAGIEVRGATALDVTDGDHVSVRGFVVAGEYAPMLEHAVVLSRTAGGGFAPRSITAQSALEGHFESEYVAVRASLTAVHSSPDQTVLVLSDGGRLFSAFGPANSRLTDLRPGSDLEVRGICRVTVDRARFSITGFNLLFDSPDSVSVIKVGPWWDARRIGWAFLALSAISAFASLWIILLRQKVETKTTELKSSVEGKRKAQEFDAARNLVLEAIARNAPPPESMEHLARAVEEQIEGCLCAIAMSPDGKSFLNGKPSAVLIAPSVPDEAQRQMLPVLSSALVATSEGPDTLESDNAIMSSMIEIGRNAGLNISDGEVAVAFSGSGELAGLIMVFFCEAEPTDADTATRVLQSASRLVSLARDHWHMHERLVFDARHDALTGLPNRTVAEDRLEQALARAQRRRQTFAVLCIDLDGFKGVNDNLGHHAGDELLRVVATRLRARIRHSDTLARIGGDEFFAIIEDCATDSAAQCVGESLIATLQEPINLDGKQVSISGSIGIAMFPVDGQHAAELKRNADQAMYRAKASGRGRTCFWSSAPTSAGSAIGTTSR